MIILLQAKNAPWKNKRGILIINTGMDSLINLQSDQPVRFTFNTVFFWLQNTVKRYNRLVADTFKWPLGG